MFPFPVRSLYNTGVDAAGAALLANALLINSTLQELRIDSNPLIGDAGAAALASMLRANATLRLLDLDECNVTVAGGEQLADALACNTSLTTLRLSGDPVNGLPPFCAIRSALARNSMLSSTASNSASYKADQVAALTAPASSVALGYLGLTRKDLRRVAAVLQDSPDVAYIDLQGTALLAEGLRTLGLPGLLASRPSLTSIQLDGCRIGDEGVVAALAPGLGAAAGLASLSLAFNDLTAVAAAALASALADHKSFSGLVRAPRRKRASERASAIRSWACGYPRPKNANG